MEHTLNLNHRLPPAALMLLEVMALLEVTALQAVMAQEQQVLEVLRLVLQLVPETWLVLVLMETQQE